MKNIMFLLWIGVLASPILSFSQSKDLPNPVPSFIAIIVSDFENTISWYTDNLGMEVLNRVENSERGFKQANLRRGNFQLEVLEIDIDVYAINAWVVASEHVYFLFAPMS